MIDYQTFLAKKRIVAPPTGFKPSRFAYPDCLFDFQRDIVSWGCQRGKFAGFEDCGLGKTLQQLTWEDQVLSKHGGNGLLLAPLGVTKQTIAQGEKVGLKINLARCASDIKPGINITNYEKLHLFDSIEFSCVGLDESSILKSYDGATRTHIIERFRQTPFKSAWSATPAPNDFMELGNHAEFLGVMSRTEMLATFFVHDGGETAKWRLKGHAEADFWKWLCTWAVNIRKPSDLGYDDGAFILPPLNMHEHIVQSNEKIEGTLFKAPAQTLQERRSARKQTLNERCLKVVEIIYENGGRAEGLPEGLLSEARTTEKESGSQSQSECSSKAEICDGVRLSRNGKDACSELVETEPLQEKGSEAEGKIQNQSDSNGGDVEESKRSLCDLQIQQDGQSQKLSTRRSLPCDDGGPGNSLLKLQPSNRPSSRRSRTRIANIPIPSEKWLIWCELNSEQDLLESLFGKLCVSIRGATPEEDRLNMEEAWRMGPIQILISKPSIFGFGVNWQHCANVVFVGLSDSYEMFYQALRRVWRFGQTRPVDAYVIVSDLEGAVLENIKRKEGDAKRLADQMIKYMSEISSTEIKGLHRESIDYSPSIPMRLPAFA